MGVDVGAALNLVGALVKYLSLAFLFPAAIALGYGESPWPFVAAGAITAASGLALELATRGKETVRAREGFLVVALTWACAAGFGALPYLLAGESQLANPANAFFESMSGFTTTGSSVLTDIEALPRGVLMWRQFTQWLGGMGIIVLALAVLPRLRVGGRQLFESEVPGPEVGQLAASIRETARRLWIVYIALTGTLAALLFGYAVAGVDDRMSLYDAVAHAFTTMPTGGFSPQAESLGAFGGATQWTVIVFMLVAGTNFALLYALFARGRGRALLRDEELRVYLGLVVLVSSVIVAELVAEGILEGEAAARHGLFQAVSILTTTGYASVDFNEWTALAAVAIVGLMFLGGSAGSTAGSIKVVRHLLIGKSLRRELDLAVHPEVVAPLRFSARPVDEKTLRAVVAFVLLYVGLFAAGALALTIDAAIENRAVSPFEAIAAAATTLGNVGPAFGFAGPFGSFEPFSNFSKAVMIVLMWLGRLEIVPVLVLFTRRYWRT
ncbi:MAG: TrkH family potassium uptake protein [Thermoleophilia bacterium]|nr:TrkH family potassium uptake protein [Thermoleophilia bacterium]